MSAATIKNARTTAQRLFTRANNAILKSMKSGDDVSLVERKFQELSSRYTSVQDTHEQYITAVQDSVDYDESKFDEWFNEIEEVYTSTERMAHSYIKCATDDSSNKLLSAISSAEEEKKQTIQTESEVCETLRDFERMEIVNEADKIRKLLRKKDDFDDNTLSRLLNEHQTDLKKQLERCKNAQAQYLSTLQRDDVQSELSWTDSIHDIYSEMTSIIAASLQKLKPESSDDRKKTYGLKLQPMPLPKFDGDTREYPRFKDDFKNQVIPSISESQQSYVLKSCLTGTPLEVVKTVDHNISEMWRRLDDKYGEPTKVIDVIMYDIKRMQPIKDNENNKFVKLVDTIESAYRDLERLNLEREISNTSTVSMIEEKLPNDVYEKWAEKVKGCNGANIDKLNKFPALLEFLVERKSVIEYMSTDLRASASSHKGNIHLAQETSNNVTDNETTERYRCWMHKNNSHGVHECTLFSEKTPEERIRLVKENRACWSCLKIGHKSSFCRSRRRCNEDECRGFHNPLLHECHVQGLIFHANHQDTIQQSTNGTCLLQLMNVKTINDDSANVLWDGGATLSLITFKKAKQLKLKGQEIKLAVTKVGGETEEIMSSKYELALKDKDGKLVYVMLYGIDKISTDLESIDLSKINHLFKGVSMKELQRPYGEIDVLIGFEYAGFHPLRKKSNGHLLLMENRFGKCIGGSHPLICEKTQKVVKHVVVHHAKNSEIQKFFEIESLGIQCTPKCGNCRCGKCPIGGKSYTIKEENELRLIEKGIVRKSGHWEAHYPWIKDPNTLQDNYQAAFGMLKGTEKRLSKDKARAALYQDQIDDMVLRGVAVKLSSTAIEEYCGPVHYISHHEVIKPESASTPCRIVFNSSAKCNGYSLNDYWAKGPDLVNNMLGILLRFREGPVALAGDIRKMYHSVHMSLLDQHTHRFLWRNLQTERKPDVYVITRVSFGDKPAGAIATMALRKTADEYTDQYPRAVESIKDNTYVDDIIDSFKCDEDKTETACNIDKILESGGFSIKEWISNESVPAVTDTSMDVCTKEVSNENSKVLGMHWKPMMDQFVFKVQINFSPKHRKVKTGPNLSLEQFKSSSPTDITKRMILSQINGIYDPLGVLTPFTIKAKVMMQDLWKNQTKGYDWDDVLPTEIQQNWINFFTDVYEVERLSFKRCVQPPDSIGKPVLVAFSDASEKAYGACSYVRWERSDGSFSSSLLCAKGKVAPTKKISIVRLELCAAVTAKRLFTFIEEESRLEFSKTIFVVDSKIVQAMIHNDSYGFNTFVSVRIGEIQSAIDKKCWSWTESENNIADWITRTKSPSELIEGSEWQCGPKWLQYPESEWPIHFLPTTDELPELKAKVFATEITEVESLASRINIDRHSSFKRLIHVTARVLSMYKFIPRPSFFNVLRELNLGILKEAEQFWVNDAQSVFTEYDLEHRLKRLAAKRREDGVIVVGERLEYWMNATYNNRELILLPYNHRFSRLYVEFIHKQSHSGASATTCKVRLKYWIIKLENLSRTVRFNCVVCRQNSKKTLDQVMGPLPSVRLNPAPAWSSISLDLFGPFETRGEVNKRSRGKAFGLILDCLYSRAVHIELVIDYSTDAFLQGFRRFMALRGTPNNVYSDPGSQLQGANNVLQKMMENIDEAKLKEFAIANKLNWNFCTSDAKWKNGCSESLIRSCKKAIHSAIGSQVLKFSELLTVMYESANLINERPIGKMNLDLTDGAYLCPNDLILGRASSRTASGPFDESKHPKRRHDFIQEIVNAFWIKWNRYYFPSLVIRQKWHVQQRNLREGDIVLIQDSNAIRGHWKMGKVLKAYPGIDGKVRSVDVQYKANNVMSTVDRPVQKLVLLLPVEGDVSEQSE